MLSCDKNFDLHIFRSSSSITICEDNERLFSLLIGNITTVIKHSLKRQYTLIYFQQSKCCIQIIMRKCFQKLENLISIFLWMSIIIQQNRLILLNWSRRSKRKQTYSAFIQKIDPISEQIRAQPLQTQRIPIPSPNSCLPQTIRIRMISILLNREGRYLSIISYTRQER